MLETAITIHRSRPSKQAVRSFKDYHNRELLKLKRERERLGDRGDREARLRRLELDQAMRKMSEKYDRQMKRWSDD